MWIVLVTLLIILAVFTWLRPWQAAPDPVVTVTPPVQPLPKAAQAESESSAAPQPAPAVAAPTPKTSLPAKAAPSHKALPKEPVKPKNERQIVKESSGKESAPTTSSPQTQVAALRELPENIQREIPALTISGYIYSSIQSERSVLINKKLLHEGDEVAPGLTLEKMMPKEAVLNYKGYRYRISY